MALTNMKVYEEEIHGRTIELLGQQIDKFNAASGGAIQLNSSAWRGNYTKESFYSSLAAAQRRVDRYATNNTQAATALAQGEIVGVKVGGGFGPILFEPSQLSWMNQNPGEAIMDISEGFANALLADQLNTAIGCAAAAIANQSSATNDVSSTGAITYAALNGAHAKFGDSSSTIVANVMTGSVFHRLIGQNLANAQELFQAGNVQLVSILGKLIVVTDAPALYVAGSPNKDRVLGLVGGAVIVDNASDIITNLQTNNGKERIETTWQADYAFGVRLKGYAWDVANGGKSPTTAELTTGSNWDLAVTNIKHTAGVIAIGSADVAL